MKIINHKYYFLILFVLLFSLSAVHAQDLNQTDNICQSVSEDFTVNELTTSSGDDIASEISTSGVENSMNNHVLQSSDENLVLNENDNADELKSTDNDKIMDIEYNIYTMEDGADNVSLSNGYHAYCVDYLRAFPGNTTEYFGFSMDDGDIFSYGADAWDKLKIAIFTYVNNSVFQEKIYSSTLDEQYSRLQFLLWCLVYNSTQIFNLNDEYVNQAFNNVNNLYNNGFKVKNGEKYVYNKSSYVSFDFMFLKCNILDTDYQDLIAYNQTFTEMTVSYEIRKITKNLTANINDQVIFELLIQNTGEAALSGVFLMEDEWDDGLEYVGSEYNNTLWNYTFSDEKHTWMYNDELQSGENASVLVFFNALKEGNFTNYITGGHEGSTKTANNTTAIVNETELPDEDNTTDNNITSDDVVDTGVTDDNDEENSTDNNNENQSLQNSNKTSSIVKKSVSNKKTDPKDTGNPLILLLCVLVVLGIVPRKK